MTGERMEIKVEGEPRWKCMEMTTLMWNLFGENDGLRSSTSSNQKPAYEYFYVFIFFDKRLPSRRQKKTQNEPLIWLLHKLCASIKIKKGNQSGTVTASAARSKKKGTKYLYVQHKQHFYFYLWLLCSKWCVLQTQHSSCSFTSSIRESTMSMLFSQDWEKTSVMESQAGVKQWNCFWK